MQLHMWPGMVLKAAMPRRFSITALMPAQIFVDVEAAGIEILALKEGSNLNSWILNNAKLFRRVLQRND